MKILQLQYFTRRRVPTLDNYLRQEYLKVKPQPTRSFIQGVPELADQIETVYSLMVMKLKNV
jgi:hypothetical protein